jgi:hypothetical protein
VSLNTEESYRNLLGAYITARAHLIGQERGLPGMALPEYGLGELFSEVDVQMLAVAVREACAARPPGWSDEAPDSAGEWVRVPDEPEALIEFLDERAETAANAIAWRVLRHLLHRNAPRKPEP